LDARNGDGADGLVEENAMIADAEIEDIRKFYLERVAGQNRFRRSDELASNLAVVVRWSMKPTRTCSCFPSMQVASSGLLLWRTARNAAVVTNACRPVRVYLQ